MYVCAECTEFQLPLLLQNGNRYKVIVRGLKLQRQDVSTTAECFSVLCRGSAEIRAGDGNFVIVIPLTNYTRCPKNVTTLSRYNSVYMNRF